MERKKKPIPLSSLMEFDSLGESSEDSDFRIEDHLETNEEDSTTEDDSEGSEESEDKNDDIFIKKDFHATTNKAPEPLLGPCLQSLQGEKVEITKILICCVCLGDGSNDDNEIVECDNCGVTVHEHCYGISENDSVSSSDSESPKALWFCDACRAGKENLSCELCPNSGGIFKETDSGMWVHLVCALYIPGVAFKDVDMLSNVTLFEMSYSKWGERVCSLCSDQQFAQTGICIGCDAGLCKTYFHVTCAQKEGLLAEAQPEEINHADPFYAHCKLHSDKYVSKICKRNWLALELQMTDRKKQYSLEQCNDLPNKIRMKDKLQKYQHKYSVSKTNGAQPWIPTQKMARSLTSSASTLRDLSRKATLSGIDTQALAMKEAHAHALADVHRKWHISPAFNVEFMGYYLDRNSRISSLKQNLQVQMEENVKFVKEQQDLQVLYNKALHDYNAEVALNKKLSSIMKVYIDILQRINLTKKLSKFLKEIEDSSASFSGKHNSQALDRIVNPHIESKQINAVPESLCLKCVTCGLASDQHLLVKCDTCQLHYHLSCLDPPLTRMPKKTRVMGWQCSECDKSSSGSEVDIKDHDTPRQLRQVKGSFKMFKPDLKDDNSPELEREKENCDLNIVTSKCETNVYSVRQTSGKQHLNKRKGRKRHRTNSCGLNDSEAQTIKQKRTPFTPTKMEIEATAKTSCNTTPEPLAEAVDSAQSTTMTLIDHHDPQKQTQADFKMSEPNLVCNTCKEKGTKANIVFCDECQKGFHFLCLNPPVKKSPKARGYSWHCTDCDPSESDSD